MSSTRVTRTFGSSNNADNGHEAPQTTSSLRKVLARLSFNSATIQAEDEDGERTPVDKAPVPTVMHAPAEMYQTPLPALSMIVLSIVRSTHILTDYCADFVQALLGEFLSANVSTPFLLFMVESAYISWNYRHLSNASQVSVFSKTKPRLPSGRASWVRIHVPFPIHTSPHL